MSGKRRNIRAGFGPAGFYVGRRHSHAPRPRTKQLLRLQGTMRPHQIISLLQLGGPTVAMADHADHIHVGFQPSFGENLRGGGQAVETLKAGQWSDLLVRLHTIENPVVPTTQNRP